MQISSVFLNCMHLSCNKKLADHVLRCVMATLVVAMLVMAMLVITGDIKYRYHLREAVVIMYTHTLIDSMYFGLVDVGELDRSDHDVASSFIESLLQIGSNVACHLSLQILFSVCVMWPIVSVMHGSGVAQIGLDRDAASPIHNSGCG